MISCQQSMSHNIVTGTLLRISFYLSSFPACIIDINIEYLKYCVTTKMVMNLLYVSTHWNILPP